MVKTFLGIFSLVIFILFLTACSKTNSTVPSDSSKSYECPLLTPEMVKEICQIDSVIDLMDKGSGQNNCGDIITKNSRDSVAAFSKDSYFRPLDMPSIIFDPVNQKDKEYQLIEGVSDAAVVTTFSSFHKIANIEDPEQSRGYALYFSSENKQLSGVLRMYKVEITKTDGSMTPGCSLEETKQLASRILQS